MLKVLLSFEIIQHAFSFYRRWLSAIIISSVLLGLVGYASDETVSLFYVSIAAAVFMIISFHTLFGGRSAFFNVVLANVITLYLCFFTFFVESLFQGIPPLYIAAGFLMPLATFLGGAVVKQHEIRGIIQSQVYINEAKFVRSFLWLLPIAVIGVLAFVMHEAHEDSVQLIRRYFLIEMGAISAIVFLASRDFTLMLVDTGILFGDFFASNARLIKPAFAFFTFYSLNIVVFAAIYRIIDHVSKTRHFFVHGVARGITFIEAMYFSLTTVSTVGYGDIVPASNAIRFIAGGQIFLGTMLFFFGVHAILGHGKKTEPPTLREKKSRVRESA
jgi:voltage-gated potassium channel